MCSSDVIEWVTATHMSCRAPRSQNDAVNTLSEVWSRPDGGVIEQDRRSSCGGAFVS